MHSQYTMVCNFTCVCKTTTFISEDVCMDVCMQVWWLKAICKQVMVATFISCCNMLLWVQKVKTEYKTRNVAFFSCFFFQFYAFTSCQAIGFSCLFFIFYFFFVFLVVSLFQQITFYSYELRGGAENMRKKRNSFKNWPTL